MIHFCMIITVKLRFFFEFSNKVLELFKKKNLLPETQPLWQHRRKCQKPDHLPETISMDYLQRIEVIEGNTYNVPGQKLL